MLGAFPCQQMPTRCEWLLLTFTSTCPSHVIITLFDPAPYFALHSCSCDFLPPRLLPCLVLVLATHQRSARALQPRVRNPFQLLMTVAHDYVVKQSSFARSAHSLAFSKAEDVRILQRPILSIDTLTCCTALVMSLNKRTGLYNIPSHHLHGAEPISRPVFNSMDFVAEEPESPVAHSGPVQSAMNRKDSITPQERKDKKKKKLSRTTEEVALMTAFTSANSPPLITVTPATTSAKSKKGNKTQSAVQSDKKRKRDSEALVSPPEALRRSSIGAGFVVGAEMLHGVQSSVKAAGETFSSPKGTAKSTEEPANKKTKKAKAGRKSNDTVDFDRMAKETCAIDKKTKKEKKAKRDSTDGVVTRRSPIVSVPVPVSSSPIFSSLPRKTPVPLPADAFSHAARVCRRDSRLLTLETPPSQLPKTPANLADSPIPFKLTDATKASKKGKTVSHLSPPTPAVDEAPSSAPPALNKNHKLQLKPDGRVSLTTSNLLRYTQPLNDEPKARPKPVSRANSAAASTAGSTTSGGTTPSIQEMFVRVGKPYSRSGAENDPFVVPAAKKPENRERHQEAGVKEFTEKYRAVQKAVNFSDEQEYLHAALKWREDNNALGPPPCLGIKASGCNTKREQLLRLSREDPSNPLKIVVTTEADHGSLDDAKQRAAMAESLLATSIPARVPVPIGHLEGVWKLYCPQYSDTHIDKWAYGQRTLTLFSLPISTPNDSQMYTARLSIPPRSMLFSILSFSVPPHASFRTTTIKTSVEGYKMDVVFLGNGYLQLRVDLSLLLSGKKTEKKGRQVVMEFVGVHERAVVWEEREDELEREGRRLFAKYDGEA